MMSAIASAIADISERVIAHVEGEKFALVERVAEEVADLLLETFQSPAGAHKSQQTWRRGSRGKRRG